MNNSTSYVVSVDLSNMNKEIMFEGKLTIHPFSFYSKFSENEIRYFMHQHGIYVLPTQELVDFLKTLIIGNAIEIGAGHGSIARALNIPITDSKMQELPEIKAFYLSAGQPVIKYPEDIEKLNYEEAINKYKPNTIIGAFITHKFNGVDGNMYGVIEEDILKITKRYINIGNKTTHKTKPILKLPHTEYYFDWIITRGQFQKDNRIFVFDQNV